MWTATLDGASPVTDLDLALPLWPVWIYPYSWVFFVGILPLCVVRPIHLFRRVAMAYSLMVLTALVCFVLVPVQMTHGPGNFPLDSFAAWGLALTLWIDTSANCFPSLHVATSVMAALCSAKADAFVGRIAWLIALLIAASTLLVKQHYIVDVIGGAALAWGCYRLLVAPVDLSGVPRSEWALDRRWALIPLGVWFFFVSGLYLFYLSGWLPPRG